MIAIQPRYPKKTGKVRTMLPIEKRKACYLLDALGVSARFEPEFMFK